MYKTISGGLWCVLITEIASVNLSSGGGVLDPHSINCL